MTEPTSEARQIAERHAGRWQIKDMAREIDALTEQRVAAAIQEERLRVEQERRRWLSDPRKGFHIPPADWGPPQNSADRPAPEGAAPTVWTEEDIRAAHAKADELVSIFEQQDGDTTRYSTPSQDAGKPGCGNRWRKKPVVIEAIQWTGDNREEVFAWLRPREGGKVYYVGEVAGTGPRLAIETLEGKTFADPGHWIIRGVKGELYPCAADIFAATYDRAEPPTDAGGPGSASASNTESSPTQAVAAPGPTAGDVERARELLSGRVGITHFRFSDPDAGHRISDEGLVNRVAIAFAAARAELLAQIREPNEELFVAMTNVVRDQVFDGVVNEWTIARAVMRALADKLTEVE